MYLLPSSGVSWFGSSMPLCNRAIRGGIGLLYYHILPGIYFIWWAMMDLKIMSFDAVCHLDNHVCSSIWKCKSKNRIIEFPSTHVPVWNICGWPLTVSTQWSDLMCAFGRKVRIEPTLTLFFLSLHASVRIGHTLLFRVRTLTFPMTFPIVGSLLPSVNQSTDSTSFGVFVPQSCS